MPETKRWSRDVTQKSDALDLEANVCTKDSPREVALSLKRSAEHSRRRKSDPYRSAMSMLTFSTSTERAGRCPSSDGSDWRPRRTSYASSTERSESSDTFGHIGAAS